MMNKKLVEFAAIAEVTLCHAGKNRKIYAVRKAADPQPIGEKIMSDHKKLLQLIKGQSLEIDEQATEAIAGLELTGEQAARLGLGASLVSAALGVPISDIVKHLTTDDAPETDDAATEPDGTEPTEPAKAPAPEGTEPTADPAEIEIEAAEPTEEIKKAMETAPDEVKGYVAELAKAHAAQLTELKKANAAQAAEIAVEREKRIDREYQAEAGESFGHLLDTTNMGRILKAVDTLNGPEAAELRVILKAASLSKEANLGELFKEAGSDWQDETPAGTERKLKAIVKSIKEKDPTLTDAQAHAQAYKQDRSLYNE